jgi:hypothetical protein
MLTRASFQNVQVLRAVTLDLAPFTVLVGGNGCGKTTALYWIEWLLGAFFGPTDGGRMAPFSKAIQRELGPGLVTADAPGMWKVEGGAVAPGRRAERPAAGFRVLARTPVQGKLHKLDGLR